MDNAQTLRLGHLLFHGAYRIEAVLGQGGFGITYRAVDVSLERPVAVKEFFPHDYCGRYADTSSLSISSPTMNEFIGRLKEKFIKEARKMARLDHPGIVRTLACFEENDTAYYVMDLVEGTNLSDFVRQHGPLPEAKALEYIRQVAEALDYLHSKRMNHLDIKPGNIMLRASDDKALIIDFGLSKQYDDEGRQTSSTPTGISHGYAPLEQYESGGVDEFSPQTDVYALGATLYYLLTGTVPPKASNVLNSGLTFPPYVSPTLQRAITHAMAPVKKYRTASVKEFLNELDGKSAQSEATVIEARPAKPKPAETTIIDVTKPNPTPKPTPKPNPEPAPAPKPEPLKSKSPKGLIIGISSAAVLLLAIGAFFLFRGETPYNPNSSTPSKSAAPVRQGVLMCMGDTTLDGQKYTSSDPIYGSEKLFRDKVISNGDPILKDTIYLANSTFDNDFKRYARTYEPSPDMGKMLFIGGNNTQNQSECEISINIDLHADKQDARVAYNIRKLTAGYGYTNDSWGHHMDMTFNDEYIGIKNDKMQIDIRLYPMGNGRWYVSGNLGPNLEVTNFVLEPDNKIYKLPN